jgi:hypothetical protein
MGELSLFCFVGLSMASAVAGGRSRFLKKTPPKAAIALHLFFNPDDHPE